MLESVATEQHNPEPIDHPIINHFVDEVSREMDMCGCDDCDPCDYEASS